MITVLTWILGAFKIVIVLGTLITIHELGHFTIAKLCNVKINKFAIGFGPKIFAKTSGETEYTIRLIPFGGFVQMEGEEERSDDSRAFNKKSVWKRIAIVAAGAIVNIVFALIIYFFIALSNNTYTATVIEDLNEGPLYEAGIRKDDKIIKVNNNKVLTQREIEQIIETSKADEFIFTIERNQETIDIPVKIEYQNRGYFGIAFSDNREAMYVYEDSPAKKAGVIEKDVVVSVNGEECLTTTDVVTKIRGHIQKPVILSVIRSGDIVEVSGETVGVRARFFSLVCNDIEPIFPKSILYAIDETGYYFNATISGIAKVFTGKTENVEVMGPIGIAKEISSTGAWIEFFYLMSAISLSLGIFNLLPVPALDGGRILILLIEGIRRKPMKESIEQGLILAGFGAIIILAIFVTVGDVIKIF